MVEVDDPAGGFVVLEFVARLAELLLHARQARLAGIKLVLFGVNHQLQRLGIDFVNQITLFDVLIGLHMDGLDVARHIGRHRHGVGMHVGIRCVREEMAVRKVHREASHSGATQEATNLDQLVVFVLQWIGFCHLLRPDGINWNNQTLGASAGLSLASR